MHHSIAALALLAAAVRGQQPGTLQSETHPRLTWKECSAKNSCTSKNGEVVLDSNWRWTHVTTGSTNCYTGNAWNQTVCKTNADCAKNCAVEGADYSGTYGITASSDALTLKLVTKHQYGTNIGSRTYLMQDASNYQMFNLLNKEFTFDVDVSQLPCGVNGALYFVEMAKNGGAGAAGAKYGTGYCDAQCPHDLKFIAGQANAEGWTSSTDGDENAGNGRYGSCCNEMDVWEANSEGTAFTPHTCNKQGLYRCSGTECGDNGSTRYSGVCDKDGCDYSHYRLGDTAYYGKGKKVDTTKKMTVVTQFVGNPLTEIRRKYVQNGQVIENSVVSVPGVTAYKSITTQMCADYKKVFGDRNHFQELGGLTQMSQSLGRGHVLVMSIWVDFYAKMLWLDSSYPTESPASQPGIKRGECAITSGVPSQVISSAPNTQVAFSNIRFGAIDSTY